MKRNVRLYNVIFPIWLILFLPTWLWLIIIPVNLAVDCLVTWLTAKRLGVPDRKEVLGHTWWRFWLFGFLADFIGGVWMLLGLWGPHFVGSVLLGHDSSGQLPAWINAWENTVGHISHNAFANPAAFLWTLAGVAIAGVCIYLFDKRAMKHCSGLDDRQKRIVALAMAIVTAPWLFFIPVY